MSLSATSAIAVNSSSRTSLSTIVPRREFKPPITAPTPQRKKKTKTKKTTHQRTHTWTRKEDDDDDDDALWNSEGATTSTVMMGSRMTGLVLVYTSRNAPSAASLNASSDESTEWAAPSCRTKRHPVTGLPDRRPFSKAS